MDINQIVQSIMAVLIPALPYLLKGAKVVGEKAAEKIGEKSGELAVEQAQKTWGAISKKKGASANKIKNSARELSKSPTDYDWQSMFKSALTQLLQENPELMDELSQMLTIESGRQVLQVEKNKETEIKQAMKGAGEQKAVIKNNTGVKIKQSKE